MSENLNTSGASSSELRERLRQMFRSGEFADRVRDYAGAPSIGRPSSLFRPLDEMLTSAAFAEFRSKPVSPEVYAAIDAMDIDPSVKEALRATGTDPQNVTPPNWLTESTNALRALSTWAEDKPGCMAGLLSRRDEPASTGIPRIERFESYPIPHGGAGTRVDGARPGEPVRIVGSGFSPLASDNEVRFQGKAAHVVKAAAGELVVLVPLPGVRAEPQGEGQMPKAVFVTGPVEVSVKTRGGTAKSQFRIEPLQVKHTQPERDLRRTGAVLSRAAQLFTTQAAAFRPLIEADETGAVQTLVRNVPPMLEQAGKVLQTAAALAQEVGRRMPEHLEYLKSVLDPEAFAGLDRVEADLDGLLARPAGGVTPQEMAAKLTCPLKAIVDWCMNLLKQWVEWEIAILLSAVALGTVVSILILIPVMLTAIPVLYEAMWLVLLVVLMVLILAVLCEVVALSQGI